MLLTQLITEAKTKEEKTEIIQAIQAGTIPTWRHVNFYGIYDFSKIDKLYNMYLNIEKIKNFRL